MNKRLATLACLMMSLMAWSQEVVTTDVATADDVYSTAQQAATDEPEMLTDDIVSEGKKPVPMTLYGTPNAWVPARYRWGGLGHMWLPMAGMYGMGLWDLHEGFNASVEAGVSVGFGKNNPWKGAAFFTNVAGLYAHQFNDRLTVAGGLYLSHYDGWGQHPNALGLFGLANYRINDRLDVTGYLSHDFGALGMSRNQLWGNPMQMGTPLLPGFGVPSTTVGADLGIKMSEHAKFNVGVSFTREQDPHGIYSPADNPTRHQMQDMHQKGRDW